MGPGMHRGEMHATQVSEDEAKAIARKYVDEQLKGYTIETVTPNTGMPRTMYTVDAERDTEGRRQDTSHQPVRSRDVVPSAAAQG